MYVNNTFYYLFVRVIILLLLLFYRVSLYIFSALCFKFTAAGVLLRDNGHARDIFFSNYKYPILSSHSHTFSSTKKSQTPSKPSLPFSLLCRATPKPHHHHRSPAPPPFTAGPPPHHHITLIHHQHHQKQPPNSPFPADPRATKGERESVRERGRGREREGGRRRHHRRRRSTPSPLQVTRAPRHHPLLPCPAVSQGKKKKEEEKEEKKRREIRQFCRRSDRPKS